MEIMKGWEPYSHESPSDTGVLLSQGFTGSTSSLLYLARKIAGAGLNVELVRLAGHGTVWQDLNRVRYRQWIQDAEDGLDRLRRRASRIFMGGLSMGGTVSLHLAARHPEFRGIILINHALLLGNPLVHLLPILKHLVPAVPAVSSDIKDPGEKEIAYDCTPTGGAHEMMKLIREVRRSLSCISVPVLMFKSIEDHVLPVKNVSYTLDRIVSVDREVVWLANSYHVATQDHDKDVIVEKSLAFVRRLA